MSQETVIPCDYLDKTIEQYRMQGYRLDMIVPADSPTTALLSNGGESVRLVQSLGVGSRTPDNGRTASGSQNKWITGRAGMEYRDLIPGRLDGRVIASHIRLTKGGEVPDYVHYHKVEFQMIYCLAGRIRVVYQGQGEPFWLEPGDCVLQPPEIRHRVLEADAGSEVLEIGMPAVHETWVEHEIELPNVELYPERLFGGQRFVRHVAREAKWGPSKYEGIEIRDIGIAAATSRFADVKVVRADSERSAEMFFDNTKSIAFLFVTAGELTVSGDDGYHGTLQVGDGMVIVPGHTCIMRGEDFEVVTVLIG
jgi:quercetin dioxygenase-like cupin family protein